MNGALENLRAANFSGDALAAQKFEGELRGYNIFAGKSGGNCVLVRRRQQPDSRLSADAVSGTLQNLQVANFPGNALAAKGFSGEFRGYDIFAGSSAGNCVRPVEHAEPLSFLRARGIGLRDRDRISTRPSPRNFTG